MLDWEQTLIDETKCILDAVRLLEANPFKIALVVDRDRRILGTISDGDIRRGILKGIPLTDSVSRVMNVDPRVVLEGTPEGVIQDLMTLHQIEHIPVVDAKHRVVALKAFGALSQATGAMENAIFILAGGRGTRLADLTKHNPKPLLKVGTKPILEIIIERCAAQGFRNFFVSTNYKADMIHEAIGDGSKWNVRIDYLREAKRLGTGGPLSLLKEPPAAEILVVNGDLITNVDFRSLLAFHKETKAVATMGVRLHESQIPFGVVKMEDQLLVGIEEKPTFQHFVNAGIYVLDPKILSLVPHETYFDMTDLFQKLLDQKERVAVFPIRESWIDIGRPEDYVRAQEEFL